MAVLVVAFGALGGLVAGVHGGSSGSTGSWQAAGSGAPVQAADRGGRAAGEIVSGTIGPPLGDAPRRTQPAASAGTPQVAGSSAEPPACTFAAQPAPDSAYDDWATTIVDTAFVLPSGYVPPDLVPVGRAGIGGWGLVRSLVIDDLRALAEAADDAGNPIAVQSAYRSRTRQAEVFAGWVASSGEAAARRFSARPGHSEHELGTALDLRAAGGGAPWSGAFGSTAAGRWLAAHATDYGFVLSYPAGAEARTCYGAEPWHVRYVGREIAAQVAGSGLTLREWLWRSGGGH